MSLAETCHVALNAAFFERDLIRNERIIGGLRRRHVRALTKALARRADGQIEPVPAIEDPDPEVVERDFIRKRRPLVIRKGAKNWPAAKLWSLDYFKTEFADSPVKIADEQFSRTKDGLGYRISLSGTTMGRFVDAVKEGASVYLKFFPVFKLHPELLAHLDVAEMDRWTRGRVARCALDNEFYMGGPRTITHLHTERAEIFHACFAGRKRWRVYPPSQSLYLYPIPARTLFVASEVDFLAPNYETHPWFRCANGYETVLEPGDVLYLPSYYWHAVENLEATVSANLLWYDKWRAIGALPIHWINGEIAARNNGGTIQSFLDAFDNRMLRNLHA
jgi:[protein]-arginine 3-hydroxylase / protease